MFSGISVLSIYVSDLEKAKKFYIDLIGFELSVDMGSNACFLKFGTGELGVYIEGGYFSAGSTSTTTRLGFCLEASGSVKQLFNKLKRSETRVLQEAPQKVGENIYWFQFEDPDGNVLEVSGEL